MDVPVFDAHFGFDAPNRGRQGLSGKAPRQNLTSTSKFCGSRRLLTLTSKSPNNAVDVGVNLRENRFKKILQIPLIKRKTNKDHLALCFVLFCFFFCWKDTRKMSNFQHDKSNTDTKNGISDTVAMDMEIDNRSPGADPGVRP